MNDRNKQAIRDYHHLHDSYRKLMQAEQDRKLREIKGEVLREERWERRSSAEFSSAVNLNLRSDNTVAQSLARINGRRHTSTYH